MHGFRQRFKDNFFICKFFFLTQFIMTAVGALKTLETSFGSFARKHGSFFSQDSTISVYKYCLELMRDGILDRDATNSFGQCFGTVIMNGMNSYDNWGLREWSALMFQWMALRPSSSSMFESLSEAMIASDSMMFWRMFEQGLLDYNFVVGCLLRIGTVPGFVWTRVQEAERWSPLRRAWIQATLVS